MTDTLSIPSRWDDVTAAWMTAAIAATHPGADIADVELVTRNDGTNRRARFGLRYATGTGPATVFVKAESDVAGRREVHAANGNLFNEPLLFRSDVELPVDHPRPYRVVIDEAALDYLIVMEDVVARGADPLDATRPMSVDQVRTGLRALARLHSRYWDRVDEVPALAWVQPFSATAGWRTPMKMMVRSGLARAGDAVSPAIAQLRGRDLVDDLWCRYSQTVTRGPQTLLHGDAHIGNTYVLPDGEIGFLDWQVVRRGSWVHDVGYFIQGALVEDDRRRAEADLVEEYRRSLDVPSDSRPAAEDAWLHYRATPVHGLTLWVVTLNSDVHSFDASLALVRRYATAYEDLDTVAALRALEPVSSAAS